MGRLLGVVAAALALAPSAQAARLQVSASAEPGAHAAAIRWSANAPARVTVEIGRTAHYGIWLRTPARARTSGRSVIGSLEPATTYRFRVTARSARATVRTAGTFTTNPFPEWTVGAVIDRTLFVDGQPFFPRMVYQQCDWAYQGSLAVGINLFMGTGCGTPWGQIAALRARAVSAIPAAWKDVADGRGTIGWYHPDEADLYMAPEALPFHPPWQQTRRVTFLTLSGRVYSGSALPPGASRTVYPRFVQRADMVGFDLYPLQVWCRRDAFHAVWEAQRELAAMAGPRATFQWIEAAPMEICRANPALDPTPLTVRAETWLAIAGGARGIGYFPDHWRPDVTAEIARLNTQISALAPALLARELPASATGPVRAGARRLNGATYVIAVNTSWRTVNARVTAPGLRGTAWIFGTSRTVRVQNGRIADRFGPLEAKVFLLPPAGA